MKKINLFLILTLIAFSTLFTACEGVNSSDENEEVTESARTKNSKDKNSNKKNKDKDTDEDDEYSSNLLLDSDQNLASSIDANVNFDYIALYTGKKIYDENEYEFAHTEYSSLYIIDDSECYYVIKNDFYGSTVTYTYEGFYEQDGNTIYVVYNESYGEISKTFTVLGDKITEVEEVYEGVDDFAEIIGEYSLDTELGTMTFEVNSSGLVDNTIFIDGVAYGSASLFKYDYDGEDFYEYSPEWDLTFAVGESEEDYYDWYLYFKKNKVTYEPYLEAIYKKYAGEYTMDGQLGVITVTVNNDGTASTKVILEGEQKARVLKGSIYYDSDIEKITFRLEDDDCSLYLEVDEFEDGDMYTGEYTLTTVLNAG